jgi:hypothetical protein
MPRREQFQVEVITTPRARVAAATRMTMRKGDDKKPRNDEGWQRTAWNWYDTIGEYRYACSWVGNLLSRAKLSAYEDGKPTTNQDAIDAMESLFGGEEGQREMLRQLGVQFTVAGEAYLIGEDGGNEPGDKWWVAAATEVSKNGDVWRVGKKDIDDPLVMRLWKPHPRNNTAPDSPSRAVLPILAEINGLTQHVAASIDSRLAGAGILLLPDGISFATTPVEGVDENGNPVQQITGELDSFLYELMQTMMTAIGNRADPSALVPILLQAPAEALEHIRHLTLSTPFDEQAIELRKEAIRRLALGMDMPPEILTGTGEINHWGAWQVEEASIKAHTEPLLQIIISSLTEGYLRPYLEDTMDGEEVRRFEIHADTSKMRLRPNRSKEAIELFDRAILSAEATVRENGFDESDMMDDAERTEFYTQKVAGGSTTPELVAQALQILGVPVFTTPEQVEVVEGRPTRSLLEHPENNPPDPDAVPRIISDEAAAVAEVVVFRALERAGNRIKSKYKDRISMGAENVPAHTLYRFTRSLDAFEVDDVLADAWSCLASLPPIPVTPATLNEYARGLIQANKPHTSTEFRRFIQEKADGR